MNCNSTNLQTSRLFILFSKLSIKLLSFINSFECELINSFPCIHIWIGIYFETDLEFKTHSQFSFKWHPTQFTSFFFGHDSWHRNHSELIKPNIVKIISNYSIYFFIFYKMKPLLIRNDSWFPTLCKYFAYSTNNIKNVFWRHTWVSVLNCCVYNGLND